MWRPLTTFPAALLAVASLLGTAGASQTGDPVAEQRFDDSEVAAEQALDFDPWTATEQELLDFVAPIESNQLTQQAGFGSAEAARDIAVDDLTDATEVRQAAQNHVSEQGELLEAFAINSFLQSDPELDPSPDAQVAASLRQAPFDAVTNDFIADFQASLRALDRAENDEQDAEEAFQLAESYVQTREEALVRADEFVETYETIVQERQDEIDARIEAALNLNEKPILGEVRGFWVNVGLVDQLEALLVAAEADGIIFAGWGHRPVDRQIELRLSHCGDSGFAIFDMPAGRCRPPTARPGHSEHELGLAIDFTENGSILTRSSPGFIWLQEHASEYGLINLPSEAWHWSTTGH